MSEQQLEQEIQDKRLTAPRVTPDHIDACIASEHYFTALQGIGGGGVNRVGFKREEGQYKPVWDNPTDQSLGLLTFCVLVLKNGFTVTGESACASPENFNAEIGRKIARQNAREKIWPLEGYLLKQHLHEA